MRQRWLKIYRWGIYGLVIYLPLHAPISTWMISNWHHELLWKGWKEGALFLLVTLGLMMVNRGERQKSVRWLVCAAVGYTMLNVLSIYWSPAGRTAVLAALAMNLRLPAALLAGILLVRLSSSPSSELRRLVYFSLAGLVVVTVFGVLQISILPDDILRHIGYSQQTIPPFQTIDDNRHLVRIISSLRGPNPLGAYLAGMLPLGVGRWWAKWRWAAISLLVGGLAVLWASGSRSAWVGLALTAGLGIAIIIKPSKKYLTCLVIAVISLFGLLLVSRHQPWLSRYLLHNDPFGGAAQTADNVRLHSATQAVQEIIKRPWGDGIGTSGLASLYNQRQSLRRMPENYYIQVGEETGLIGLLLLLAMIGLSVWQLIRRPAVARFIALGVVAVSICSLFVPAWGDETVAITLWLLAGAALALSGDKLKP